jgi:hypothetical protein
VLLPCRPSSAGAFSVTQHAARAVTWGPIRRHHRLFSPWCRRISPQSVLPQRPAQHHTRIPGQCADQLGARPPGCQSNDDEVLSANTPSCGRSIGGTKSANVFGLEATGQDTVPARASCSEGSVLGQTPLVHSRSPNGGVQCRVAFAPMPEPGRCRAFSRAIYEKRLGSTHQMRGER